MQNFAKKVLDLGAPYLIGLTVSKVAALLAGEVYIGMESLAKIVIALALLLTSFDIVIRMAASRKQRWNFAKHGTDTILIVLFSIVFDCVSCEADGSTCRYCRATRLMLPFAVLVSLGGNMMRFKRKQKPPAESGNADEVETATVGTAGPAVE